MSSNLSRSLFSRLGLGTPVATGRRYTTDGFRTPRMPLARPGDERPPSTVLHMYGLPSMRSSEEPRRVLNKVQEEIARTVYEAASQHAPVAQVLMPSSGKNFGWVEFVKLADATSFVNKHDESNPFTIMDRAVRIQFGDRQPVIGEVGETPEVAVRYNTFGISSKEAMKLVQERFPEASLATNVKSSRGVWGTIFARFASNGDAVDAFRSHQSDPIRLGEAAGQMTSHSDPIMDLHLYNLKPFTPLHEVIEPLKQFGDITKFRFSYQAFGPRSSGRVHVAFSELSQAQALMEATMNEQLVLHDMPVRAEYQWMRYNPRPRTDEGYSESADSTTL